MSETDTQALQPVDPAAAATSTQEDTSMASEHNQADVPEAASSTEETSVNATATATSEENGFLGGKYKTAQEFEEAYKELKNTYDRSAQEKAELSKILNEAFASDNATSDSQTEDDIYSTDTSAKPVDSGVNTKVAIMEFMMIHSDADGAALNEILKNDPMVAHISTPEAKLQYAYLQSQVQSKDKALASAKQEGVKTAQAKIVEKQVAQVETAQKAQAIDEKTELRNTYTSGNPDERAAARAEYIKKFLV